MYLATNRFKIAEKLNDVFEELWRSRDSFLQSMTGYISFNLIKVQLNKGSTRYISHSKWKSKNAFTAWTRFKEFSAASQAVTKTSCIFKNHPTFEGFEVVI